MALPGATMIGDTWHDKQAAQDAGIAFIEAQVIHQAAQDALEVIG